MFFSKEMIAQWKDKCEQDRRFAEAFEALEQQVSCIDATWIEEKRSQMAHLKERADIYGGGKIFRYGNEMRKLSQLLLDMAVVFAAKQESCAGMFRKIFEILLWEPWCFQGRFNGWKSDLWTAGMGINTALAWELVREELTDEENKLVKTAIWERGFLPVYEEWVQPKTKIHALDTMGHNWWAVCVSAAGAVLLTLGEEGAEGYAQKLDEVTRSMQDWFDYSGNVGLNKHPNFGTEGDFLEYVSYMTYGLSNFCVFYTLLEQQENGPKMDVDRILEKIPDFVLDNLIWTGEGLMCADFGDNSLGGSTMELWYFLSAKYERKDLLDAANEIYTLKDPYEMFFYPVHLPEKKRELPTLAVYQNSGHAVLRTGQDKSDLVFVMKAGESWNHNHLDAGTFELAINGEKCITDSGTCTYSNPLYLSYYVQPCAHNTITFDGQGQWPGQQQEGTRYPGCFDSWIEKGDFKYLLADCTGPYMRTLQRYYRHVILSGKKVILIDDVEGYQDGCVETHFHGNGPTILKEKAADILMKNQILRIDFPFAEENSLSLHEGYLHAKPENEKKEQVIDRQDYLSCAYQTKNSRCKCVTVLFSANENEETPVITAVRGQDVMELRIEEKGRTERYLINCRADGSVMHHNGWAVWDGFETDALIVGLFYESQGGLESFFIQNGSTLRTQNEVLFSSNIKSTVKS